MSCFEALRNIVPSIVLFIYYVGIKVLHQKLAELENILLFLYHEMYFQKLNEHKSYKLNGVVLLVADPTGWNSTTGGCYHHCNCKSENLAAEPLKPNSRGYYRKFGFFRICF